MNIGRKSNNDLLFINFNQDLTCISVGTRQGYSIYNCDPIGKCFKNSDGAIGIVEMMFSTSLIALVGAGEQPNLSPRRLQIINTKRQSIICEIPFTSAILAVKLNRKRLIVILEEHIYIYDISNMKLIHSIDTSPNPNAICSLSPSSENCYFAYLPNHSGSAGEIVIFDAIKLQPVTIIQAHKSPLSCISFNYDGSMIATSSDKGTVIRVFAVPSGKKLYQFRRGTYPAKIFSISFSIDNTLLCVSSATDTVHIFKLNLDLINKKINDLNYVNNKDKSDKNSIGESSSNGLREEERLRIGSGDSSKSGKKDSIDNKNNSSSIVIDSKKESKSINKEKLISNNIDNNTHVNNSNNNIDNINNLNNVHNIAERNLLNNNTDVNTTESFVNSSSNSGSMNNINSMYNNIIKRSQLASVAADMGSYVLPDMISGMWEPSRDFAYAKLPTGNKGQPNICSISNTKPATLMLVTASGKFYQFSIDTENGGECILLKEEFIID